MNLEISMYNLLIFRRWQHIQFLFPNILWASYTCPWAAFGWRDRNSSGWLFPNVAMRCYKEAGETVDPSILPDLSLLSWWPEPPAWLRPSFWLVARDATTESARGLGLLTAPHEAVWLSCVAQSLFFTFCHFCSNMSINF